MYVRTMHTGESAVHSEPAVGRERGAAEGEVRVVRSNWASETSEELRLCALLHAWTGAQGYGWDEWNGA